MFNHTTLIVIYHSNDTYVSLGHRADENSRGYTTTVYDNLQNIARNRTELQKPSARGLFFSEELVKRNAEEYKKVEM
jgi:hypothetical protein